MYSTHRLKSGKAGGRVRCRRFDGAVREEERSTTLLSFSRSLTLQYLRLSRLPAPSVRPSPIPSSVGSSFALTKDDAGDYVVVENALNVHLTGKKATDKKYFFHSGYPGGEKWIPITRLRERHPEDVSPRASLRASWSGIRRGQRGGRSRGDGLSGIGSEALVLAINEGIVLLHSPAASAARHRTKILPLLLLSSPVTTLGPLVAPLPHRPRAVTRMALRIVLTLDHPQSSIRYASQELLPKTPTSPPIHLPRQSPRVHCAERYHDLARRGD